MAWQDDPYAAARSAERWQHWMGDLFDFGTRVCVCDAMSVTKVSQLPFKMPDGIRVGERVSLNVLKVRSPPHSHSSMISSFLNCLWFTPPGNIRQQRWL